MGLRTLVLFLLAAAFAGCVDESRFPEAYLLRGDEIPRGLELVPGSHGVIEKNPGEIPSWYWAQQGLNFSVFPRDAWVEELQKNASTESPSRYTIVALRWPDGSSTDAAILELRASAIDPCEHPTTRILRDGVVLVLLFAQDSSQPVLDSLVEALRQSTPHLAPVCAP